MKEIKLMSRENMIVKIKLRKKSSLIGKNKIRREIKKKLDKKPNKKPKKDSSPKESDSSDSKKEEKKKSRKKRESSPRGSRKSLLPERYDRTTPLTIFLTQFEFCARYYKWSIEDKAIHLRVRLKGNAAYIIDDETFEDATYEQLVARLKSRFGTEGQSYLYQAPLRVRRRGKKETLQALYHDISRMAGLEFPRKSSIHR